jgi:hypothetical protein
MASKIPDPARLERLTQTADLVDQIPNRTPNVSQPYVRKHAFAHKAKLHAAATNTDSQRFQHVDPAVLRNPGDVLVSELSGHASIVQKLAQAHIKPPQAEQESEFSQPIIDRANELENHGFQFDPADGSLKLLTHNEVRNYDPLFRLNSSPVTAEKRTDRKIDPEATINIWIGGDLRTSARSVPSQPTATIPHQLPPLPTKSRQRDPRATLSTLTLTATPTPTSSHPSPPHTNFASPQHLANNQHPDAQTYNTPTPRPTTQPHPVLTTATK